MIRPLNATVAGCAAIIGYLMATGTLVTGAVILFLVVFLVTGAGNAINDYFDVEIDRINRPDRPIPSGAASAKGVFVYSSILFIAGITLSLLTNPFCIAIAVANSLLLIWYAASLKRTPGAGNAAISYLTASIFLFGGAYAGPEGLLVVTPLALITFFAMLAREIWKDAEDLEGDRAQGADTLPIRIGVPPAIRLGFVFLAGAIFASLVPVIWWGLYYLAGIATVDILIMWVGVKALGCKTASCLKKSQVTTFVKYAMFVSLAVFAVSAVLL
ncbi:MAG: Digeranylgeranylglyceryl phosphate synthase [Methanoregulaceae archaeon PtaB.Bin056]|nr:MAG: Digeranylgeranylglyceryl phosphate synthase [Methanoregulaceae archaeon PtaB.Bin056]